MNATETHPQLVLARLAKNEKTLFRIRPDAAAVDRLKGELDLLGLRKLRFEGELTPEGRSDWRLNGMLGATVVQPCSVTLAPVTTRIDVPIIRRYVAGFEMPSEAESEMPEDDSTEALPEMVDLMELLAEELAIALPDFPRAEGAELGEKIFTEPGVEPLTEEASKPFAGLAALKKSIES